MYLHLGAISVKEQREDDVIWVIWVRFKGSLGWGSQVPCCSTRVDHANIFSWREKGVTHVQTPDKHGFFKCKHAIALHRITALTCSLCYQSVMQCKGE